MAWKATYRFRIRVSRAKRRASGLPQPCRRASELACGPRQPFSGVNPALHGPGNHSMARIEVVRGSDDSWERARELGRGSERRDNALAANFTRSHGCGDVDSE